MHLQRTDAGRQVDHAGEPRAFDCLHQCGLRDGNPKAGQFCIDTRLAYALKGDVQRGLFFRGSESLPFGAAIRPVRQLVHYLLTGEKPVGENEDVFEDTGAQRRLAVIGQGG